MSHEHNSAGFRLRRATQGRGKQPSLCSLLFGNGRFFPTHLTPSKAFWGAGGVISISDELVHMVRELCRGRPTLAAREVLGKMPSFPASLEKAGMSTAYPGKGMPCPRSHAWRWLLGCDINNAGSVVPPGLPHVSDGSACSKQA